MNLVFRAFLVMLVVHAPFSISLFSHTSILKTLPVSIQRSSFSAQAIAAVEKETVYTLPAFKIFNKPAGKNIQYIEKISAGVGSAIAARVIMGRLKENWFKHWFDARSWQQFALVMCVGGAAGMALADATVISYNSLQTLAYYDKKLLSFMQYHVCKNLSVEYCLTISVGDLYYSSYKKYFKRYPRMQALFVIEHVKKYCKQLVSAYVKLESQDNKLTVQCQERRAILAQFSKIIAEQEKELMIDENFEQQESIFEAESLHLKNSYRAFSQKKVREYAIRAADKEGYRFAYSQTV